MEGKYPPLKHDHESMRERERTTINTIITEMCGEK
jgi:hypothetical protein